MYRLVGELNHHCSSISKHVGVLGYDVPNGFQILLIVVANSQVLRTYSRWAHDDVKSVVECFLSDWPINGTHVLFKTGTAETADVSLACFASCRLFVWVVGPAWVEVQTEEVAISTLLRVSNSSEQFLKIVETCIHRTIVAGIPPAIAVEIRIWRIHHTMQHDLVAIRVSELIALHVEWLNNSELSKRCRRQST